MEYFRVEPAGKSSYVVRDSAGHVHHHGSKPSTEKVCKLMNQAFQEGLKISREALKFGYTNKDYCDNASV